MCGQARLKHPVNMVDLSRRDQLLNELTGIRQIEAKTVISKVEMLVKFDYGWLAIGKLAGQPVVTDVNLIAEDCWDILVSSIANKKAET
jgi:hypothetical protein